jgi:hypothetical protein
MHVAVKQNGSAPPEGINVGHLPTDKHNLDSTAATTTTGQQCSSVQQQLDSTAALFKQHPARC